jgi:diaminopimelate epimerase
MKKIPFWKMSGSGNDFVLIDNRKKIINGNAPAWARRLCFRQEGVGADGLLLLEKASPVQRPKFKSKTRQPWISDFGLATPLFRMVYYNADGSRAGMCGNGARCMAWFAHQHKAAGDQFTFETDAYPVSAIVKGDRVRVTLADAKEYRANISLAVGSKTIRAVFLNTGVPHLVVFVPRVKNVDVAVLGRALRYHKVFAPAGANVNFVQIVGPRRISVRTYERGVEGETLACGTGVAAGAIAAVLENKAKGPVQCVTAGGAMLTVHLTPHPHNAAHAASDITLEGSVRLTFKGEVHV